MSRIGKKPIQIPQGVEAKIESNRVFVKGPKGELNMEFCPEVKVEQKEGSVIVSPALENKKTKAILAVNLFGNTPDYDGFLKIAKKNNLKIPSVPNNNGGGLKKNTLFYTE